MTLFMVLVMHMEAIEAHKKRDVAVIELTGTFLHLDMDKLVNMRILGTLI